MRTTTRPESCHPSRPQRRSPPQTRASLNLASGRSATSNDSSRRLPSVSKPSGHAGRARGDAPRLYRCGPRHPGAHLCARSLRPRCALHRASHRRFSESAFASLGPLLGKALAGRTMHPRSTSTRARASTQCHCRPSRGSRTRRHDGRRRPRLLRRPHLARKGALRLFPRALRSGMRTLGSPSSIAQHAARSPVWLLSPLRSRTSSIQTRATFQSHGNRSVEGPNGRPLERPSRSRKTYASASTPATSIDTRAGKN